MYILYDLYHGNVAPLDESATFTDEDKRRTAEIDKEYNAFYFQMPQELREHYDRFEHLTGESQMRWEEQLFARGFRIGVKMILDVIGDRSAE